MYFTVMDYQCNYLYMSLTIGEIVFILLFSNQYKCKIFQKVIGRLLYELLWTGICLFLWSLLTMSISEKRYPLY